MLSVLDCSNLKLIEKQIYLAPLDPKAKDEAARAKRLPGPERLKWLELLRVLCYPFFNENRPKTTGILLLS